MQKRICVVGRVGQQKTECTYNHKNKNSAAFQVQNNNFEYVTTFASFNFQAHLRHACVYVPGTVY